MTASGSPFLRFSRDKRGYEHFYLVQQATRRGRAKARILYWFRTPPNVKVGRVPFDEQVRREIESQNPGVGFDWKRLLDTPIPPPPADVERWRERRRLQRATRAAAAVESEPSEDAIDEVPDGETSEEAGAPQSVAVGDLSVTATAEAAVDLSAGPAGEPGPERPGGRKRRRRRGGRRRRHVSPGSAPQTVAEPAGAASSDEPGEAE